jgi:hypothetical protein
VTVDRSTYPHVHVGNGMRVYFRREDQVHYVMLAGDAARLARARVLCAASRLLLGSARQTVADSVALCAVSRQRRLLRDKARTIGVGQKTLVGTGGHP